MSISLQQVASLALFVHVATARSFSVAARQCGLSKSAVSRRIAQLETEYGTLLIQRTTRGFSLTEAGTLLYQHGVHMLKDVQEADTALREKNDVLHGTLRVNAPITFAHLYLTRALVEFMQQNPSLRVELTVTDALVDLVQEHVDVAIRMATLKDSRLVARKIATDHRVVFGAPAYFRRFGVPTHPQALHQHNCLRSFVDVKEEWVFQENHVTHSIPVTGTFMANNGTVLREAVLGGLGVARLPWLMVENEVRQGQLQTILDDFRLPAGGIYAVYAYNDYVPKKIRSFVDFLIAHFRTTGFSEPPISTQRGGSPA